MPTSAKKKIKKKPKITWGWIDGDECPELFEHFGFPFPNADDRIKVKFVKHESREDYDK